MLRVVKYKKINIIYKNNNNLNIACSLNNETNILYLVTMIRQSNILFEFAKYEKIYIVYNNNYYNIAYLLNNSRLVHNSFGNYEKAIKYCEKWLIMLYLNLIYKKTIFILI